MIIDRFATLLEPRSPRGYVGRHRAPRHLRYIAAARVQPAPATVDAQQS